MEELLEEVDRILRTCHANIERNKKYHDYPFTQNCAHYYKLILLHHNFEVWKQCRSLLEQYKKNRMGPLMHRRSEDFMRIIDVQKKGVPGFITKTTEEAMLEYIRKLEWIIEELEAQLYTSSKRYKSIKN